MILETQIINSQGDSIVERKLDIGVAVWVSKE